MLQRGQHEIPKEGIYPHIQESYFLRADRLLETIRLSFPLECEIILREPTESMIACINTPHGNMPEFTIGQLAFFALEDLLRSDGQGFIAIDFIEEASNTLMETSVEDIDESVGVFISINLANRRNRSWTYAHMAPDDVLQAGLYALADAVIKLHTESHIHKKNVLTRAELAQIHQHQ